MDTHCYNGYEVPPYYDSMIAKVIVHAPTRQGAINRMLRALDEMVVVEIDTTIPALQKFFAVSNFKAAIIQPNCLMKLELLTLIRISN